MSPGTSPAPHWVRPAGTAAADGWDAVVAPGGTHLYYLNVMAGPGPERAWLIRDDPAHAWVREDWGQTALDSRLPLDGSVPGGAA